MESKNYYDFLLKINSIARIGLTFSTDPYALTNYQTILDESNMMIESFEHVNLTPNTIFERRIYPTPNISVRTICLNEKGQVLLVQEAKDQGYSLPGGWCDLYDSPSEAARNECRQEAGADVVIERLVGVINRTPFVSPVSVPEYALVFKGKVQGSLHEHEYETLNVDYFDPNALPTLSKKMTEAEIKRIIFAAINGESIFD
ncbi:MAG TPA: NUDIX hydrolase N-terminal domain-containing protein [Bacilli bacterium]|nr:NUDIX hydrolase N-terminal domain-containing protein [Bacilli bacterium]